MPIFWTFQNVRKVKIYKVLVTRLPYDTHINAGKVSVQRFLHKCAFEIVLKVLQNTKIKTFENIGGDDFTQHRPALKEKKSKLSTYTVCVCWFVSKIDRTQMIISKIWNTK